MALKVIGAGLGRTGTLSLKLALEHIGFGPCYHAMEAAIDAGRSVPLLSAAIRGEPDWDALFDGYLSTTDYPGCSFWPQLRAHYPDAKVLLSVRDADGWFDSVSSTLFSQHHWDVTSKGPMREMNEWMRKDFGDRIGDRGFMTDYFNRWNQSVIDNVPADKLLVFSSSDGWEPLCNFLDVATPEAPYPRVNSRDELKNALGAPAATREEATASMRSYLDQLRQNAFGSLA